MSSRRGMSREQVSFTLSRLGVRQRLSDAHVTEVWQMVQWLGDNSLAGSLLALAVLEQRAADEIRKKGQAAEIAGCVQTMAERLVGLYELWMEEGVAVVARYGRTDTEDSQLNELVGQLRVVQEMREARAREEEESR